MPTIEIDGRTLEAEAGEMVIQVADRAGIYIPRFCYHDKLSIAANCRMCLVEVENAPKPLPACATPVSDGMKVFTDSKTAVEAQKGTMEFLLINHPLDCPVCDQGGECPLQDQAMGYGKDVSRFSERKRVVEDKDIGPLIATEMTRCIHCTRCVRFGQEIAGIMELGATGRGEHMEIGAFLGRSVDSEVSGNVIDLCPVGALTSRPYRFAARAWELENCDSVSPHDCVGANLNVQSVGGVVKRVLPRVNEAVNECWLADRDRYSYESCNHPQRLTAPMLRVDGTWQETDWEHALEFTAKGLSRIASKHGAEQLGALASPTSTLEEFYLLQKLLRSLGSHNVDHRLRQTDFSNDDVAPICPTLGGAIAELGQRKAILLVGSNVRKEQPLLGLRIRQAARGGAAVMAINPLDYHFHFALAHKRIVPPGMLAQSLARVAKALFGGRPLPAEVEQWAAGDPLTEEQQMARAIKEAGSAGQVLLGTGAIQHRDYSVLHSLAQIITERSGAALGLLTEANGVGGWLAGCVPHRGPGGSPALVKGRDAATQLSDGLRGYLLFGVEPLVDCADGHRSANALAGAEFVAAVTAFDIRQSTSANVLLPMAPFTENEGTFVNCQATAQRFYAAVSPAGDAKPGWKILRVLANHLGAEGFDYVTVDDVRQQVQWPEDILTAALAEIRLGPPGERNVESAIDLERVIDIPLYRVDAMVRRARALQHTQDNLSPAANLNEGQARRLGVAAGDVVTAHGSAANVQLKVAIDERVPDQCVYIPAGWEQTAPLGGAGLIRLVRS